MNHLPQAPSSILDSTATSPTASCAIGLDGRSVELRADSTFRTPRPKFSLAGRTAFVVCIRPCPEFVIAAERRSNSESNRSRRRGAIRGKRQSIQNP